MSHKQKSYFVNGCNMQLCVILVAEWECAVCVCVVRLKGVLEQMDRGVVDLQELRRNLELAAAMLDAVYTDETRWDGRK